MAIKGNLREASLPDVLQLLAMGQKTGCLSVTDRSNFGYIYFDRGRITYASIVNRRDAIVYPEADRFTRDRTPVSPARLAARAAALATRDRSLRRGMWFTASNSENTRSTVSGSSMPYTWRSTWRSTGLTSATDVVACSR